MISYQVYKVMHLTGVFMVILSLGGLAMHVANGGVKQNPFRKQVAMTHGIGLLISLVGGFGLLARLGIMHGALPAWVLGKLTIWLIFGGMTALLIRKPQFAKLSWLLIIVLAGTAAFLANYKPVF